MLQSRTLARESAFIKQTLFALALCGWLSVAAAQNSAYHRVQLEHGISLELPSHWKPLSADTRSNVRAAGQAMAEAAAAEGSEGKRTLLAVNAPPAPTGAIVRVSFSPKWDLTDADLAQLSASDLEDLGAYVRTEIEKVTAQARVKVVHQQLPRIERLAGRTALILEYERTSATQSGTWRVMQQRIAYRGGLLEFTVSHRRADEVIWRPIIERVRRSLRLDSSATR
jgi:hypothetical protein